MSERPAVRRAQVPAHLRTWLFDPRSLSRRLACACPGGFRVRVLEQRWRTPLPSERAALSLRPRVRALVREAVLLCHDTPWVYARSVFPAPTALESGARLARLGARPLGKMLFATRGMRRDTVVVSDAARDAQMYARCARALGRAPGPAYKRASVFRCRGRALLVSELFLEEFGRD